ncbi:hypothetical protein [Gordonia sp. SL306]|uniref:hypothetical protein n=1 Tax=Gordonia sp. SL306 TaxID=2995145 RepID=UPI00226FBF64|nr:hypothetical protein [Gordonia sp. SL306]WAC55020.1 hypothetical protein OVA31_20660 [Gordonia sp. SL306]
MTDNKPIQASVDNHGRLGGPRVSSRETSKATIREEFGVARGRRLAKDLAEDLGVIRGRALTSDIIDAEEGRG